MKFLSKTTLFLAAALLCFSLKAVPAYAVSGASQYIQTLGDQALTIISNKSYDKDKKQDKLEKVFADNVDAVWVGRFVMGRYWREATEKQKARYLTEYKKFLMKHYTSRFTAYSGGSFKVISEKDDGDGEYTVSMQLKSEDANSEPVLVDYRVRKQGGTFKIFDVIVEGVGLLSTQRSEFASVIANNGIDYLIDQLVAKSGTGAI